jgi:hypothetical protein
MSAKAELKRATGTVALQSGCAPVTISLTGRDLPRNLMSKAKMIGQLNSYRYYYYYGPLSARRDGWAIGCRETD